MIFDSINPGLSLQATQGPVDGPCGVLAGATCPQRMGVGGDSYWACYGEAIAGAQAVLDQVQHTFDLIPASDTERT